MYDGVSTKDGRKGMRSNVASFSHNTRTGRRWLKAVCDNVEVCIVSPRATSKQTNKKNRIRTGYS